MYDQVSPRRQVRRGAATLPLAALDLTHPVYLWLPADAEKRKRRRAPARALAGISEGATALRVAMGGAAALHDNVDFDPLQSERQQV